MEFKLLVVDDEPRVTAVLAAFFLDRGYRVVQAASGDEALAALRREPMDLAVLDLHMPGLPGEAVLRDLRAHWPMTKVVVVTGYPDREPAVRAIGCDAFLAKPLAVEKLVKTLSALLADKDTDELRDLMMGGRSQAAAHGQPVAQLLIIEPVITLAHLLETFFGHPADAGGVYKVHIAADPEQAVGLLLAAHPDLVLLDLLGVDHPAEVAQRLLACEVQPKDYLFYLHPHVKEEEAVLSALPAKRWEGNPFKEEGLKALADLVRRTALEHGLVRR